MNSFTLRNNHFELSPLSVELHLQDEDAEGWRAFTLSLLAGQAKPARVAHCAGSLSRDDWTGLIGKLEAAAGGGAFEFSPLESWFMLRCRPYSGDEMELLWVVDEGMASRKTGTDTGIGFLMIVSQSDIAAALAAST